MNSHAWLRQAELGLTMRTSFGNGNGNGNGNGDGWRMVGLGLGLGLGHRITPDST